MSETGTVHDLIGDRRHLASVRRMIFADGPERGLEAVMMSAGPLALTVLAGRAMDIGSLTWQGVPIGWTGPSGYISAAYLNAEGDSGRGFDRALSGFLMTGGLTHIRQPANGEPLHGRLPFTPARVLACSEDWAAECLYCESEVRQVRYGHESLVMRRRIEVPLLGSELRITDTVTNEAREPISPELLYHFNLGYPAIGPGTSVTLDSEEVVAPLEMPAPGAPTPAYCIAGGSALTVKTPRSKGAFEVTFRAATAALPALQFWRDLRPGIGLFCVEPCTSPPGSHSAKLEPGEARTFHVVVSFRGMLAEQPT